MDTLYVRTLTIMEFWLAQMEQLVPPPIKVQMGDSFQFRYKEQSLEQALIQKLARMTTGLRSARLLLNSGQFQDQASIQRMLDDAEEDILFLGLGYLLNDMTERHKKYLESFYEEEFDNPESALDSTQKRWSIPRDKVRAYIANKGPELLALDS